MTRIHLASGILIRDRCVLLVASRYANQPQPLWGLPGGRQRPGELLPETVARETLEETGLHVEVGELLYVSESYDGEEHFLNATFALSEGAARRDDDFTLPPVDHVVAVAWVPIAEVATRIAVAVVREPLIAALRGELTRRYAGYPVAGITIRWPSDPSDPTPPTPPA